VSISLKDCLLLLVHMAAALGEDDVRHLDFLLALQHGLIRLVEQLELLQTHVRGSENLLAQVAEREVH